jgi:two-component system probable response regulator PhcQ
MQTNYDYRKYAVLYVDDEEKSLKYFALAFGEQFRILTAPTAQQGLLLLEQHKDEIGLLMTDQRMPGEKGVWLLEKARQLRPRIVRILVTAYADMDAAVAAVNSGAIYKYISKPWDPPQLEITLMRALEFFIVQHERDQLLKEKLCVLHNMMIADRIMSLGLLAAGLSHHIRNALVAVKTFLDLAPAKMAEEKLDLNGLRNPEFWRDYYQNVQSQLHKINGLISDLWTASEKPALAFLDEVRLHEVVGEVLGKLNDGFQAKRLQIENQIPDSLPSLKVDRPKFRRLFELLFRDELVSLPAGSRIRLTARQVGPTTNGNTEIEVEISDNGPGLPEESLRLMFDPFMVRSDSPAEYGINLMACFFIVHHHGGRITARSDKGQGTTFTLRLHADANRPPLVQDEGAFLQRVLMNDTLWEKLLASA